MLLHPSFIYSISAFPGIMQLISLHGKELEICKSDQCNTDNRVLIVNVYDDFEEIGKFL